MTVTRVSSVIGHKFGHNKTHKRVSSVTHQILEQLKGGNISKAVSVLFASPEPVAFWLYERLFRSCSSKSLIVQARKIQSHLVTFSPLPPIYLSNRAIEAYGKCKCVDDAQHLFEEMPERDGGSWNSVITACAQNNVPYEVFRMFRRMNRDGVRPTETSFSGVLKSCGLILDLRLLKQIHCAVMKPGFLGNVDLETSVVDVYGKCRVMSDARRVFDEIGNPNDVSWNVIVRRYLEAGFNEEAVVMFFKMLELNTRPLNHTVSSVILACTRSLAFEVGIVIHAIAVKLDFVPDTVVSTSIFHMYLKCGRLKTARRVLDITELKDLKSWTSVMSGYATSGITGEARRLFDLMPERDIITWNAMLGGYVRAREWDEALDFFTLMRKEVGDIDDDTLVWILNICSGKSHVQMGKEAHGFIYRHGYYTDVTVANALLNMYRKCRCLDYTIDVFKDADIQDLVTWNSLIRECSRNGRSKEVFELFMLMEDKGIKPDHVTFLEILHACIREGHVEHGYQYFSSMSTKYLTLPQAEHYRCMLELYCKYGCLHRLGEFLLLMPFEPTVEMLTRVSDACQKYGRLKLVAGSATPCTEVAA